MRILASPNKIVMILAAVAAVTLGYFVIWWHKDIEITGQPGVEQPASSITGMPCEHTERRPIAVMIASDPAARPLSGISQADLVFEMPVTPNGVTRMMAVFQCEAPPEIGSIRSARLDFIPLAKSLAAIYAHWGGEKEALEQLNEGILDNIDAFAYEGTVFYRKPKVKAPHNGFTDIGKITKTASELKYSAANTFKGYPHTTQTSRNIANIQSEVVIPYDGPYAVTWKYDDKSRTYSRFRDGTPETDANNGKQVAAGVVIKLKTESRFVRDQYISVNIAGEGNATVYQNGVAINGTWQKNASAPDSRLVFYESNGREIAFAPGKIWIEVVTQ